jgi:hypothetical protein
VLSSNTRRSLFSMAIMASDVRYVKASHSGRWQSSLPRLQILLSNDVFFNSICDFCTERL